MAKGIEDKLWRKNPVCHCGHVFGWHIGYFGGLERCQYPGCDCVEFKPCTAPTVPKNHSKVYCAGVTSMTKDDLEREIYVLTLETEIEQLEPKTAPDGGETVLPL